MWRGVGVYVARCGCVCGAVWVCVWCGMGVCGAVWGCVWCGVGMCVGRCGVVWRGVVGVWRGVEVCGAQHFPNSDKAVARLCMSTEQTLTSP